MTWIPPKVEPHDEPVFSCQTCLDCGWEMFWCNGQGPHRKWERPQGYQVLLAQVCGRPKDHTGHLFVERCQCWMTNPAILRRREREAAKRAAKDAA